MSVEPISEQIYNQLHSLIKDKELFKDISDELTLVLKNNSPKADISRLLKSNKNENTKT